MQNLDVSWDYGAVLWRQGAAVDPEDLPISATLCERIQKLIKDSYRASKDEEWDSKYEKEELVIALQLQQELPEMNIRVWRGEWVDVGASRFHIPIENGLVRGPNFLIFPALDRKLDYANLREGISIDEEIFSCIFFFFGLSKSFYLHKKGVPPDEEFDWWGENYFTYEEIGLILSNIRYVATQLERRNYDNPKLVEFWQSVRRVFGYMLLIQPAEYRSYYAKWDKMTEEEQYQFMRRHHYVLVDFYYCFIAEMNKMREENPDCQWICFSGP